METGDRRVVDGAVTAGRARSWAALRARSGSALSWLLVALAGGALAVLLAQPHRGERSISGGLDGMAATCLGAAAFALLWRTARGWQARGDVLAGMAVLGSYVLFERNLLVMLLPFVAALAWYALRAVTDTSTTRAATDTPSGNAPPPARVAPDTSTARVLPPARLVVGVIVVLGIAHALLAVDGRYADVGQASMQGASALLDGRSPYQDPRTRALLGDTYGPLAYELYVPAVAALPRAAAAQVMALLGHLALAAAVWFAALRIGGRRAARIGVATWLAFPASVYTLSVAAHDDIVSALAVAALVVASPLAAGLLVGAASAAKLYPALLVLPLLRRHRAGRGQLVLLGGVLVALALATIPIALASSGPWVSDVLHATVINQGSRAGAHLWGVPLTQWRLDLPYNFWTLWNDQLPAVHALFKVATVLVVLVLAARVPAVGTPGAERAIVVSALGGVCLLLLALNNLSWNYVSWFAPLVALALFTPEAFREGNDASRGVAEVQSPGSGGAVVGD